MSCAFKPLTWRLAASLSHPHRGFDWRTLIIIGGVTGNT